MAGWDRNPTLSPAEQAAATARTTLNPNTEQSTGSSNTTASTNTSGFQGMDVAGRRDLQSLINTLMYGTATPPTQQVYYGSDGKKYSKAEYDAAMTIRRRGWTNDPIALPGVVFTPATEATAPANFAGTDIQAAQKEARKKLLDIIGTRLQQYSPDSAQADSLLAMQSLLQKSLEANMPAIQRSIENAGTSGGSQQALLAQDLTTRSAGEVATLGLKAKTDYGNISANLSNVLGGMTAQQDPVVAALIDALKGAQIQSNSTQQSQNTTENRQSGPIGISNPSLFQTSQANSSTPNTPTPTPVPTPETSYYTYSQPSNGSGVVQTPWSTTLIGGMTPEEAVRKLSTGNSTTDQMNNDMATLMKTITGDNQFYSDPTQFAGGY